MKYVFSVSISLLTEWILEILKVDAFWRGYFMCFSYFVIIELYETLFENKNK